MGHLDGMTFSIDQLRASMVGKAARRISRWALEPTSQEAALHAKCEILTATKRLEPLDLLC